MTSASANLRRTQMETSSRVHLSQTSKRPRRPVAKEEAKLQPRHADVAVVDDKHELLFYVDLGPGMPHDRLCETQAKLLRLPHPQAHPTRNDEEDAPYRKGASHTVDRHQTISRFAAVVGHLVDIDDTSTLYLFANLETLIPVPDGIVPR